MKSLTALFILVLFCAGGCTTTLIEGEPSGGKCYLNEQYIGTAPFSVTLWAGQDQYARCEMVLPGHDRSECPRLARGPGNSMVEMTSAPAGAQVYIDGVLTGTTPFFTRVWFPGSIRVLFPKTAPQIPAAEGSVSCDLRVIRVADGTAVCQAGGRARPDDLQALARTLVEKLKEGMPVRGESIAVASLRNRSGSESGRVISDEMADKIAGALIDSKWFEVKERIDLRAIMEEKDLDTAAIINNPKVRTKLGGIKYLVIGGATAK